MWKNKKNNLTDFEKNLQKKKRMRNKIKKSRCCERQSKYSRYRVFFYSFCCFQSLLKYVLFALLIDFHCFLIGIYRGLFFSWIQTNLSFLLIEFLVTLHDFISGIYSYKFCMVMLHSLCRFWIHEYFVYGRKFKFKI